MNTSLLFSLLLSWCIGNFVVGHEKGSIIGCNYLFTSDSYAFTSPGYPDFYPNNTTCTWTISVNEKFLIELTITEMDLESSKHCKFDSLIVLDGENETAIPIHKLCGKKLPQTIQSVSNILTIIMSSDGEQTGKGFKMMYKTKPACTTIYNIAAGVLKSPGYPIGYTGNTQCSYNIIGEEGKFIHLYFEEFQLEEMQDRECFDFVTIFTSGDDTEETMKGKFCGQSLSKISVCFKEKIVTVKFVSDASFNTRGFKAAYMISERKKFILRKIHNYQVKSMKQCAKSSINDFYKANYSDMDTQNPSKKYTIRHQYVVCAKFKGFYLPRHIQDYHNDKITDHKCDEKENIDMHQKKRGQPVINDDIADFENFIAQQKLNGVGRRKTKPMLSFSRHPLFSTQTSSFDVPMIKHKTEPAVTHAKIDDTGLLPLIPATQLPSEPSPLISVNDNKFVTELPIDVPLRTAFDFNLYISPESEITLLSSKVFLKKSKSIGPSSIEDLKLKRNTKLNFGISTELLFGSSIIKPLPTSPTTSFGTEPAMTSSALQDWLFIYSKSLSSSPSIVSILSSPIFFINFHKLTNSIKPRKVLTHQKMSKRNSINLSPSFPLVQPLPSSVTQTKLLSSFVTEQLQKETARLEMKMIKTQSFLELQTREQKIVSPSLPITWKMSLRSSLTTKGGKTLSGKCGKYISVEVKDGDTLISTSNTKKANNKIQEILRSNITEIWEVVWPYEGVMGRKEGLLHYGTLLYIQSKKYLLYIIDKKVHLVQLTEEQLSRHGVEPSMKLNDNLSIPLSKHLKKIPSIIRMTVLFCD